MQNQSNSIENRSKRLHKAISCNSYYLSRFQNESSCSTIVREMNIIDIKICNSFPFESLCTRTHFKTDACSKSEMAYCNLLLCVNSTFPKFPNVSHKFKRCTVKTSINLLFHNITSDIFGDIQVLILKRQKTNSLKSSPSSTPL